MTILSQLIRPSRVTALVRYLRTRPDFSEEIDVLEKTLMPESVLREVQNPYGLVQSAIAQCVTGGILENKDGSVKLMHKNLDPEADDYIVRLNDVLFGPTSNNGNDDLGNAIAWFLSLDVFSEQKFRFNDLGGVERHLNYMRDKLDLNDGVFSTLVHWASYLGFAQTYSLGSVGNSPSVYLPEPSKYFRLVLDRVFTGEQRQLGIGRVIDELAKFCPILETGRFRTEVEKNEGRTVDDRVLSPSTSLAWQKLGVRGDVKLELIADAEQFRLHVGKISATGADQTAPYSHIILLNSQKVS